MSEPTVIGIPLRRHTLIAIGTVLGLAFGAGAQVALSKATIASHESRITAVESSAGLAAKAVMDLARETAVHNAARDQQQDSIKATVDRMEDKLDRLSGHVNNMRPYRTVYAPAKK